ncbi:MarR family winged helix-turn-helix transcriptional regulator [Corynebacterium sp. ES2715-CONJ3]|uniref:MarR family winged helix-turn-helix transcriptional regulator n=1 Tax=Corynebacterium sp. ES2715-CONJ3 TaxID=2974028 RepID=UPI0021671961|nr:MarR family transcriptional regulator [Corynebacterium sp. ES2715-CONJ3]MCS4492271.1 MarR family transcriptional regulator [Corynebacterium sp. ES2715-CONJ3]
MNAKTARELAIRVRPALTKLYVLYFRKAQSSDLTGPQLTILARLAEEGACRISHIAKAEGIRMPTASNALHQLEDRGMVERLREEADRRGVRVQLTDFGRRELTRVGEERIGHLTDMFTSLPEEDYDDAVRLASLIQDLADSYGDIVENAREVE